MTPSGNSPLPALRAEAATPHPPAPQRPPLLEMSREQYQAMLRRALPRSKRSKGHLT